MTESPVFRALVTPLIVIVVFFTFARACTQTIRKSRAAVVEAEQTTVQTVAAAKAAAPARKFGEIDYPPGLDAERIQYLVTIEHKFSEPLTMQVPKSGYAGEGITALQRLGYLEKPEYERYRLSREGIVNLSIARETDTEWTFTIAKRVFDGVTAVQPLDGDTYRVTIGWHWDPTPLAKQVRVSDDHMGALAEFRNDGGRWVFVKWNSSIDTTRGYR